MDEKAHGSWGSGDVGPDLRMGVREGASPSPPGGREENREPPFREPKGKLSKMLGARGLSETFDGEKGVFSAGITVQENNTKMMEDFL